MPEKEVGKITHYFGRARVAAVRLTDTLSVGDMIHIKGHTSDFTQTVDSMQIEHNAVQAAHAGQSIGIRVTEHAREQDTIYKVLPE